MDTRMDLVLKWGLSSAASVITFCFGGWSEALAALFYVVVLDFLSGLLVAGKNGELKSKVGYIGIQRKIYIFIMVAVGHILDSILGNETSVIARQLHLGHLDLVEKGHVLRDAIVYFYIFNEVLSIIENGGKAGLPIPGFIRKMVEVLQTKGDESND